MTRIANCRCGAVYLEFDGEPIMTVACYCHSCQQAGKDLEALADASAVMDADDGTQSGLLLIGWFIYLCRLMTGESAITADGESEGAQ